jgi:hypothetical protein
MQLRADEIVVDADSDRVLLRGKIDWPDGRTTTSVVITCSGKGRYLGFTDHDLMTDDRLGDIDPDLCKQLAKRVQGRK